MQKPYSPGEDRMWRAKSILEEEPGHLKAVETNVFFGSNSQITGRMSLTDQDQDLQEDLIL